MMKQLDPTGPVTMMTASGARGNKGNIGQLGAMRGLMADPSGRIIDVPVRSNFREGMTVLEYFISTHGARKGLADTALRTADSGYLTRRLVDVAQDVITREEDCGTEEGSWIIRSESSDEKGAFQKRLVGRLAAAPLPDPAGQDQEGRGADAPRRSQRAHHRGDRRDRSTRPASTRCSSARRSPARLATASAGRATAATSPPARWSGRVRRSGSSPPSRSASPGTQLTMRTFHTGGVAAGVDITAGLPRVEELFEARIPKGKAEISHIDGTVEIVRGDGPTKVKVISTEVYDTSLALPKGAEMLAAPGDLVELGQVLARTEVDGTTADVAAPVKGFLVKGDDGLVVRAEDRVEREYLIPHNAKLLVENNAEIRAGDAITDGPINPQEYLDTRGKDAVQRYLVKEVQKVYKSQGVTINDKHIEIIVRQMLRKVRIDQPGDVDLLPTELVDRLEFEEHNNRVLAEGGEPATAQTVLLGVTKASLNTSSFLAAASFQETTRVLTEAAINGAKDHLIGLKENVIIGKLIPAGTGAPANVAARKERERRAASRPSPARRSTTSGRSTTRSSTRAKGAHPTTMRPASRWRRRSPGWRWWRRRRGRRQPVQDRRGRRPTRTPPTRSWRRPACSRRPPKRASRAATFGGHNAARRTFDTLGGPPYTPPSWPREGVHPRGPPLARSPRTIFEPQIPVPSPGTTRPATPSDRPRRRRTPSTPGDSRQ